MWRGLVLFCIVGTAWARPCADRVTAVQPAAAPPGATIELLGTFSIPREAQRPRINRGSGQDLEILRWTAQRLILRVPAQLPPGAYKVGVYCDGRPGPQRFLHSTDWLDFVVQPAADWRPPIAVATPPPTPETFQRWLLSQPWLADEIVWEEIDGPVLYRHWPALRRDRLYQAFARAARDRAPAAEAVPANLWAKEGAQAEPGLLRQRMNAAEAEALYLDALGHSLALEYRSLLPWSLRELPPEQLEILLDARQFFAWREVGYEVELGVAGMALPSSAAEHWAFLQPRLGPDRRRSIVAVLDWLRDHAMHFEGKAGIATMQQQWQYPGFPPVARILAGTPHQGRPEWPIRPRTAGCFGTAGFLRALLRSANIPVRMVSTCAHFQVSFPSEGLYLSHGDDPYSGDFTAQGCSSDRLLIDEATFQAWFRQGSETVRCGNVGRGAREIHACR